jgi:uncharacterized protein (DUF58 family)
MAFRVRIIPGRTAVVALGASAVAALVALLIGVPVTSASLATAMVLIAVIGIIASDAALSRQAWARSAPVMTRRLPPAFANGLRKGVQLALDTDNRAGALRWHIELFDHADPSLKTEGLPLKLRIGGGTTGETITRTETGYTIIPTTRGEVTFAPADVRVRSRWGFCELLEKLGTTDTRRVFPDFAAVARYAWLAGDRRLQEIGIKTYQLRGQGTDFKQLSEYRVGDSVRHIDWRATLRVGKPIVREFQDDRDQNVLLMVDCGRRMRADDREGAIGTTHFDQVLNAIMLLTYVALKQGDAVGAMTFGTPPGEERSFAPRKGARALDVLMGQLYDVQPTPTHSDYVGAAQALIRQHRKRSLIIIITNFRDEDSAELGHALRLLRPRHLVLLASLRERIVGELLSQPLVGTDAAIDIASAHLYEQSRRDAFNRLSTGESLMVDAEPERLGIELVNRYHAVKRAGLI